METQSLGRSVAGIMKRPVVCRHRARAHVAQRGPFVPTNGITAGEGIGFTSGPKPFCFDSIARDVPLPPQSSARMFAQKAETRFCAAAAVYSYSGDQSGSRPPPKKTPSLGPDGGEPHVPSICLSSSLFSLGGKLHSHTIKLERSQARQNGGCERRSARPSG